MTRHVIRYIPGTHLADKWGDGPCGSFGTREEAEWVMRHAVNAEYMEVVEVEEP